MAKPVKKAAKPKAVKDEVQITYRTAHGITHNVPLKVPVAPGHGEAIINDAAKHGCTDIEAVRAQIRKHY